MIFNNFICLLKNFNYINYLINRYQRTTAGLKSATQAVTPAFASIGGTMKNSLSNLRQILVIFYLINFFNLISFHRNSTVFKSFETGISSTTVIKFWNAFLN